MNFLICSGATELNMTHDMFLIECRAFGAQSYRTRKPRPDGRGYSLSALRASPRLECINSGVRAEARTHMFVRY